MRALDKKLLRDLWGLKGELTAIAMVLAVGVVTYVMSLSTLQSLAGTKSAYYERYRFADAFASVERAPKALEARLAEIPGVALADTRLVEAVVLDVPGMDEPAVGRLISIPDRGAPRLNAVHLKVGRFPDPGKSDEVVASEAFTEAHGLVPGDRVVAILEGRRQALTIVGVGLSPEYVYQVPPGDILPDNLRFGVFWMRERAVAAAFDLQGAFDDVAFALEPEANEAAVLEAIDDLLSPYGGRGAFGRGEQVSHRFVENEISELRTMGIVTPTIFLSVAVFLIAIVMGRLVGLQREQVAVLKAFGYTNRAVSMHYLSVAISVAFAGAAVGVGGGALMGRGMTGMYTEFFNFPLLAYRLDASVGIGGALVAVAAAAVGAWSAVRMAAALPPAEAMRPQAPGVFRQTLVERLLLGRALGHTSRMVFRQMARRPGKTALSALGISLAVAIVVLGKFSEDGVERLMDHLFFTAQRQDVTVVFGGPVPLHAAKGLSHAAGVLAVEPFRSVPVTARVGHRTRRLALTGIVDGAELAVPMGLDAVPVEPAGGLVVSSALGDLLGAGLGSTVAFTTLVGAARTIEMPIAAMVDDLSGTQAYLSLRDLGDRLGESPSANGAYLAVDSASMQDLYADLKARPAIAGVSVKEATLESFRMTMAEGVRIFQFFNLLFSAVIAVGVVYNNARISLAERRRELATLRVVGFSRGEVSGVLLGEMGALTLLAIPLGFVVGYGFALLATMPRGTDDLFRFPLVILPSTYAFAALVVLAASLFAALVVRRQIDRLDMLSVLKAPE